jgi:hypothetical protein
VRGRCSSVSRALAAVDVQHLAGDERCVLQIKHGVDDVVDLTDPAERMHRRHRVVRGLVVHGCANDAERDRVDRMPRPAYSMASDLVTAFRPPSVSDANADGTAELAWSTRLVEIR